VDPPGGAQEGLIFAFIRVEMEKAGSDPGLFVSPLPQTMTHYGLGQAGKGGALQGRGVKCVFPSFDLLAIGITFHE
jgi:hypothetical protein